MKRLITTAFIGIIFASCNVPVKVDVAKAAEELRNTDKAWSDANTKDGFAKTIDTYYDENVMLIEAGQPLKKGKANLTKQAKEHPDTWKGLSWTNESAEVASSGDMGYTWGHYQVKTTTPAGADTIMYGVYSTIWKKQADGKWQAVLDETTSTPKP